MEFLVELAPHVIKFPKTENEKIQTANGFKRLLGFPNVIGCMMVQQSVLEHLHIKLKAHMSIGMIYHL